MVYLAPTGVAAVNIKGQTIHSFFRFKPNITYDKIKKLSSKKADNIYKKLDAIVIDEISMVRADLLDYIDRFMRLNGNNKDLPFGGAQMIFIGDLYQLPPVVTGPEREIFRSQYQSRYFFDAKALADFSMEFIELEKIYRQSDADFIELLNAIRNNTVTDEQLGLLNERLKKDYELNTDELSIYLTTTNKMARSINDTQMRKLSSKLKSYRGTISGDFNMKYLPTDEVLNLKIGAQIMLLNNDSEGRWVNGTVGKIIDIDPSEEDDAVIADLAGRGTVAITPHTWKLFRFNYDQASRKLVSESIGSFTQYPLTPAWAITIHKSQGKTFDNVVIDIGRGTFAHGQMYVALSRCTSLAGLVLKKPIVKKHIFMDWRVVKFVTQYQYRLAEENTPLEDKIEIIQEAIEADKEIHMLYLKASDEKSSRSIRPNYVGEMEYLGRTYLGVRGFDSKSQSERNFRVDRILELEVVDKVTGNGLGGTGDDKSVRRESVRSKE